MTKIFITGITGYIGGDILFALSTKHPEYNYRVLVRDKTKTNHIQSLYPSIQIVEGSIDDVSLLERESSEADIVIHNADAADHLPSAKAIAKGLETRSRQTDRKPGYWIHTSGAGILSYSDTDRGVYGKKDDKVYDDWDGIKDVTVNMPDHAFHRDVDKIVLDAGIKNAERVKTAIVSPTSVYGPGRGPISQRSRQIYELARLTLSRGKAPIIGAGQSIGTNIHIYDLTEIFVLLVEAAVAGRDESIWGGEGYYFVGNGEHCWGELARLTAGIAVKLGYIASPEVEVIDFEEAKGWNGFETGSWGLNVRARGYRAGEKSGWKAVQRGLEDEMEDIVRSEWERLH